MKHIYAITSEDRTLETEYLSSSRALNQAELLILKECISTARQAAKADDKAYDVVNHGVDLFHDRTGRHLTIVDDPVAEYITI